MEYIKAMWVEEIKVIDPYSKNEVEVNMYKTENGWMFGLDAGYDEQILSDDELEQLGYPIDRLDIVFGIYSPIEKDTIIICDEPIRSK